MNTTLTVVGLVYFEVAAPIDSVRLGREKFVDRIGVGIGGAFNTAWIAHALGVSTVLAHPCGTGLTDRAISTFVWSLGLPSLTWDGRDETAISLVLTSAEDRAFVSAADFSSLERCPDLIGSTWIHVPGLIEANVLKEKLAAARARGSRISVSGSWAVEELSALASSRPPWDLLILNQLEAERAVGSVARAPEKLASVAPNVVVTCGSEGAIGAVDGERFTVPARRIDTDNTTGAGDAFAAGFLAAYSSGSHPRRAAEVGCEVAARRLAASEHQRFERSLFEGLEVAG